MEHCSDFRYDLKFGQVGEKLLADIFNNRKIEVKRDKWIPRTGNIAIEYESRGKPSGILKTEADWWAFIFSGNVEDNLLLMVEVKHLKNLYEKYSKYDDFLRNGGDKNTSKMVLIPIDEIRKPLEVGVKIPKMPLISRFEYNILNSLLKLYNNNSSKKEYLAIFNKFFNKYLKKDKINKSYIIFKPPMGNILTGRSGTFYSLLKTPKGFKVTLKNSNKKWSKEYNGDAYNTRSVLSQMRNGFFESYIKDTLEMLSLIGEYSYNALNICRLKHKLKKQVKCIEVYNNIEGFILEYFKYRNTDYSFVDFDVEVLDDAYVLINNNDGKTYLFQNEKYIEI